MNEEKKFEEITGTLDEPETQATQPANEKEQEAEDASKDLQIATLLEQIKNLTLMVRKLNSQVEKYKKKDFDVEQSASQKEMFVKVCLTSEGQPRKFKDLLKNGRSYPIEYDQDGFALVNVPIQYAGRLCSASAGAKTYLVEGADGVSAKVVDGAHQKTVVSVRHVRKMINKKWVWIPFDKA